MTGRTSAAGTLPRVAQGGAETSPLPGHGTTRAVARAAALALCAALLALAACRTEKPLGEGVVSTPDAPATDQEREAAALAAVGSATQALSEGDALGALAIATRALREGAPPTQAAELRRLRAQARDLLVRQQVARLVVVPERDAIADGSDVRAVVRIRNLSSAPLQIPATASGSSPALLVVEVTRDDFDVYGNVRSTDFNLHVPLPGDVDLLPGGTRDLPVTIPAERLRLTHTGFSVVHVGGTLRPIVVRVGATELFEGLALDEGLVRVFMQGFEPLAADPLAALSTAVVKRSPPHILTAAELLAPDERERGAELLRRAADADPPLAFVCNAAAARLEALLR
mgnify:CR=1 FL=1